MNNTDTFTGYITKYALSRGIIQTKLEVASDTSSDMVVAENLGAGCYFHGEGKDWHRSLESATAKAEKMRLGKIALLEKSIKALKTKEIKIVKM